MLRRSGTIALVMVITGLWLEVDASARGPHLLLGAGTQISTAGAPAVTTMRSFVFSAVSLPNGKAGGANLIDIRRTNGDNKSFLMSIQCVAVEGNQAVLIGTILWSTLPTDIGLPAIFGVEDNGEGKKQKVRDRITNVLGFAPNDAFLPDYTVSELRELARDGELIPIDGITQALGLNFAFPPLTDLTLGNIVVE